MSFRTTDYFSFLLHGLWVGLCSQLLLLSEPALKAVAPSYPPLVETDISGKVIGGMSVEIVKEIFSRAGHTTEIEILPWARLLLIASRQSNIAAFPMIKSRERENLFEWLGPVNRFEYKLCRLKSGPARRVTGIADIKNETIGVLNNDIVFSYIKEKNLPGLYAGAQIGNLVKMLLSSRIDYLVITPQTLNFELKAMSRFVSEVEYLFTVTPDDSDQYSYLVMAKGSDPILCSEIKKAFASVLADGTWDKIFTKYQGP